MAEEIGAYNTRTIREIPDDEFAEQRALFEAEGARRDYMEAHESALDDFLARHREAVGLETLGRGEEWFEPADVFDAYPLGAHVTYEGEHYRSKRHANMQPPTMRLWWEKIPPAQEGEQA